MTLESRSQTITKAVLDVIAGHMSMGQAQKLAPEIESAINRVATDLDAIEVEANAHSTTLGQKFQALLKGMMPNGCPDQQALFAQAFFLGGGHSVFQILAFANTRPAEESLVIWTKLQSDIKSAAPKKENLIETPPEKRLII